IAALDGRDRNNGHLFVTGPGETPRATVFGPVVPNPFAFNASLAFSLATGSEVDLAIYGVDGRRVKSLAHGLHEAGEYHLTWNTTDESGAQVRPGLFFA